jgi:hypothetical protein
MCENQKATTYSTGVRSFRSLTAIGCPHADDDSTQFLKTNAAMHEVKAVSYRIFTVHTFQSHLSLVAAISVRVVEGNRHEMYADQELLHSYRPSANEILRS